MVFVPQPKLEWKDSNTTTSKVSIFNDTHNYSILFYHMLLNSEIPFKSMGFILATLVWTRGGSRPAGAVAAPAAAHS